MQYLLNGRLPIDAEGTLVLPKIPTREYVGVYQDHWDMTDEKLIDHFTQLLHKFLHGLA